MKHIKVICNVQGLLLKEGGFNHLMRRKGIPHRSRDSVVGIATSYVLDDRGVGGRVPVGSRIFSKSSRPALRSTQPPIQCLSGTLSPGVKRPGREVDHSPPTSAEVNKMWIYTSTPPYVSME
jgi:hypothetical protein